MRPPTSSDLEATIIAAMHRQDWAAVTHLQPQLDTHDQTKTPVPTLSAALYYAQQGLHVFPLQPRLKLPYRGTRGLKEATTDPQQIVAWWTRWPNSNVAIATGHLVDVIDIDGPVGVESWARTTDMPDTVGMVTTPRPGGTHLYIKTLGLKNGANFLPGIDVRGLGGYVCAPPSIHPNGGIYRWRHPLDFNRVLPALTGPVHEDSLCRQCGHPLDVEPHPKHYLAG